MATLRIGPAGRAPPLTMDARHSRCAVHPPCMSQDMPDFAVPIDHAWANKVIDAVDRAFRPDVQSFASSLRLALMDLHRDPRCPRGRQLMGPPPGRGYLRLPLLGPRARSYDLLLIGWPPGHSSPIHDHQGLEGFELMLDGRLKVESYVVDASPKLVLQPLNQTLLTPGQAEHFGGGSHAHRCSNPSVSEPALSLHIYARHLNHCQQFTHDGMGHWSARRSEMQSERPAIPLAEAAASCPVEG